MYFTCEEYETQRVTGEHGAAAYVAVKYFERSVCVCVCAGERASVREYRRARTGRLATVGEESTVANCVRRLTEMARRPTTDDRFETELRA